jgi:hypothetical protein
MQPNPGLKRRLWTAAILTTLACVSPAEAQDIELAAGDGRDFFGDWALTLETPDGNVSVAFNIGEARGKVALRFMGAEPITNITKSDEKLIARYQMNYQGTPIPVVITVARVGENLVTTWDFADGAYTTTGTATRPG